MMNLRAELANNTPHETYHGIVFSRRLMLRLADGTLLLVHDPENIANQLPTGHTYDFVVAVIEKPGAPPELLRVER